MKRRIGIYSGTFDPVHAGHLTFAQAALKVCSLDEVVLLPEQKPREKREVTDIDQRLTLLEEATRDIEGLRVIKLDDEKFTVQHTLPRLRALFGDAHLTFLVGSDVVRTFRYRWEGLEVLLATVSLAIGMRAGDDRSEIEATINELAAQYGIPIECTYIDTPHAHLASSHMRNR